jgi:(1->4)-alpha-D-glucan 1-alpha-D-glucosylmutase
MTTSPAHLASRRAPTTTYRLQISREFDLDAATGVLDYLAALGVDWVYVSPLLTAEPGSNHGYDVVDHATVDPARGGNDGLVRFGRAAHALGLGVLVDIVPNHVGVASPIVNRWWWDVLCHGRESRYAAAFDIDWDFGHGRLRIPVLGDEPEPVLTVVDSGDGRELRYHDHRFPVRSETARSLPAGDVHDDQHYELVNWRRADSELNYRRFFAVNSLAAIRVEDQWVFDESHREILRWIDEGLVDGLRVDHPDGLYDPVGYLDELRRRTGGRYVLVEKILEGREQLPASWSTDGTTGYEALADIDRVLVDPAGRSTLDTIDAGLRGSAADWSELMHDGKRWAADTILRSEVLRVAREIRRSASDGEDWPPELPDAIAELAACLPVYRTYLPIGSEHLEHASRLATERRPDLAELFARTVAVLSDPSHRAATRFQQTSGMIMAKGVEDRAFYQFTRLSSLTEVGGDPAEFTIDLDEYHHRQQQRLSTTPLTMTTLSTHDTKRGEDVRARIHVLSEVPELWATTLDSLRRRNPLPDGPFEQLIWQTVIGAWPITRDRLAAYVVKAAREAGTSTSWTDPDGAFEGALANVVGRCFDDPATIEIIEQFVRIVTGPGRSNSLAAKLLQLTSPGVPDVYQGTEVWEDSLVDPDNRRPVDFTSRRSLLASISDGAPPAIDDSGAAKMRVATSALRLRRDRPTLFGGYEPVRASGRRAEHVVGFDRGGAITLATRHPVRLAEAGGWADTSVRLPRPGWRDVISGRRFDGAEVDCVDLFTVYPVALLAPRTEEEP